MEEYKEAMWKSVLEQGPPQSDGEGWLKNRAYDLGWDCSRQTMGKSGPEAVEIIDKSHAKLEAL